MNMLRATPVNDTRTAAGRTLPQLLRDRVREFGAQPAIRSKRAGIWRQRDWADVYRLVRLCARGLAASGLQRGEVVGLVSENMEEQFLLELAALCLGARVVAAYPDASVDELGYLLEHAEAAVVVGEDQEQVDKILAIMPRAPAIRTIIHIDGRGLWDYNDQALLSLDTLMKRGASHRDDAWLDGEIDRGRQDDVAVYCYTSGTTGRCSAAVPACRPNCSCVSMPSACRSAISTALPNWGWSPRIAAAPSAGPKRWAS